MQELILKEKEDGILVLKLNNPEKLNILSREMRSALRESLLEAKEDDEVRVIIITGEGRAFAAGANIKEMVEFDANEAYKFAREGQELFKEIENLPKPVIAAVNGYALGGGMELAMACDTRIASEKAVFGQPEVHLGLVPGFAGSQRLTRLVGYGWAKRLILTGERIDAEKAYEIGLVEEVVPHEKLMERARELAKEMMKGSPLAIAYAKDIVNKGRDANFEIACSSEAHAFGLLFATGEAHEGLKAFIEKRKPRWQK